MHPSTAFRVEDEARLLAHLASHPFVTLAAAPAGRPLVAHTPVVVRQLEAGLALDFHLSRGNALAPHLPAGFRGVAVSLGPEAYISPDWYESPDQVPSWNYITVEAEGPVVALNDTGLVTLPDDLSAQEEARLAPKPPWTRGKMQAGTFERMSRRIIGARMTVERFEGTFKLSQNKGDADLAGAIAGLGDHPIAARMRRGPGQA